MQPSITVSALTFQKTRSVRSLAQLIAGIVGQRRTLEVLYSGYCTIRHRPSQVCPCSDQAAVTRILERRSEFENHAVLYRSQLNELYGGRFAIHSLPADFEAARRQSVWLAGDRLILGEYGESPRIACITPSSCLLNDYYRGIAAVRHIHSVLPYGSSGEFLVSTGDGRKVLDLWQGTGEGVRFVRRLRRHLAGFTAAVEIDGEYYFGSDFSGRPNFIETLGGAKYFFPEKAYKLHAADFYPLFGRYIVSVNKELNLSGGRRTLSVFDTVERKFVSCEYLQS